MNLQSTPHAQFVAELCADLVDILTDSIDDESLHALVSVFLEASGAASGSAFTVDQRLEIEKGLTLKTDENVLVRSDFIRMPYVAQRALHTLQTEFSMTSGASEDRYEYSFPLRVRGKALGAIVLESNHSHLLQEEIIALLQSIADLAASTIDHTHQLQQHRSLAAQLQTALNSRIVLEQAKGILAERTKTDCTSAFGELRQIARREQRPIHHVASDIVNGLNGRPRETAAPASASVA